MRLPHPLAGVAAGLLLGLTSLSLRADGPAPAAHPATTGLRRTAVVEAVERARLHDGSTYPARVWARDPENDLAVLKIDAARPLAVMPLGTASDLMVGEPVIAIGNAFGYEHTVSVGVVSALNRDVTLNREV